jgi:hypothetical protein
LPGRVLVDFTLPADSSLPGPVPAQDARWPGVGNRLMSAPVSAVTTSTTPVGHPGTGDRELHGQQEALTATLVKNHKEHADHFEPLTAVVKVSRRLGRGSSPRAGSIP